MAKVSYLHINIVPMTLFIMIPGPFHPLKQWFPCASEVHSNTTGQLKQNSTKQAGQYLAPNEPVCDFAGFKTQD